MGIGRRYYALATLFLCALYCQTHYEAKWPDRGFHPTSGWGNKWRRQKEDKAAEERKKAQSARKKAQALAREEAEVFAEAAESEREEARREFEEIARVVRRRDRESVSGSGRHGSGAGPKARDPRRGDRSRSSRGAEGKARYGEFEGQGQGQEKAPLKPIQRWR